MILFYSKYSYTNTHVPHQENNKGGFIPGGPCGNEDAYYQNMTKLAEKNK